MNNKHRASTNDPINKYDTDVNEVINQSYALILEH